MKKQIISILLAAVMLIGMTSISALAAGGPVSYRDANGEEKYASGVTEITAGGSYGEGWYVLKGTKTLEKITFTQNTHLILADGADITVSGGILVDSDEHAKNYASLTIYSQSAGTGKLTVKDVPEGYAGIGSGFGKSYAADLMAICGDITINGGVITATGGKGASDQAQAKNSNPPAAILPSTAASSQPPAAR